MADLAERINSEFHSELHVIFNDDNADKLILRLRVLLDADAPKEAADSSDHDDTFLKKIEASLLTQCALQGVNNIKKVFIRETDRLIPDAAASGGYASEKEWMLDTEGVNLLEVMCHPAVDATRTISNDLHEVIDVLGIEAARGALLKEVRGVIEFDGSYVNYRHLAILCDAMTSRGHFAAITRHGINRGDGAGALAQASFEETVEILYRAATFAESDGITGVSEAVMLGQLAPVGTGAFGLLLDEARLADAVEVQVAGGAGYDGYGGAGAGGGYGAMPTPGRATPGMTPSHASPSVFRSPGLWSPLVGDGAVQFSPAVGASPAYTPAMGAGGASPAYSPSSPAHAYGGGGGGGGHMPPGGYGPSPTSPAWQSPASPAYAASPAFQAGGGGGAPAMHASAGPSPYYSPSSPAWAPGGAAGGAGTARVSPTSPAYDPQGGASGAAGAFYSPSSPAWSPAAVDGGGGATAAAGGGARVSPTSPAWSPHGGPAAGAAGYSAASPAYSPSSPAYSPGAAAGAAPAYVATSPQYSPSSPAYAPTDAPPPAE